MGTTLVGTTTGASFRASKISGHHCCGPHLGASSWEKKLVGTRAVGTTSVDQGRLWCHKSRFSWHPGRSKSPRSKSTFQGSFQWRPPHWCQGGPIKNLARYGIALRIERFPAADKPGLARQVGKNYRKNHFCLDFLAWENHQRRLWCRQRRFCQNRF